MIRPARFYDPLIFGHFAWPRHVRAFKAIAAAFYLHCGVYCYGDGFSSAADNLIIRSYYIGKAIRLPSRSGLGPQAQAGAYQHLDEKRHRKAR